MFLRIFTLKNFSFLEQLQTDTSKSCFLSQNSKNKESNAEAETVIQFFPLENNFEWLVMSFELAVALALEQLVSKNSFKQICLIICNIKLLQIWLLKVGLHLSIFLCISLKFLN